MRLPSSLSEKVIASPQTHLSLHTQAYTELRISSVQRSATTAERASIQQDNKRPLLVDIGQVEELTRLRLVIYCSMEATNIAMHRKHRY